jgi:aldehyde dehydrogenase (NAD+)
VADVYEHIDQLFVDLNSRATGPASEIGERLDLLRRLRQVVNDSKDEICQAVYADFRKTEIEAELTEIATVLLEIRLALSDLAQWMTPKRVRTRFPFWSTRSRVTPQPKGIVLIISPWNYPFLLALAPIISAVAAGNRIILKPSERTPNTSALLTKIVDQALGPDWCAVVPGDETVGAYLIKKPFDHFFFTGSPRVGRVIMSAAAEHWSSVTLELGGKSPAIVDETADIGLAAEKIIVGKYLNAGQTCIAPDFVLANEVVYDDVLAALTEQAAVIAETHDARMTGIVDQRHEQHLRSLWDDARQLGATKTDGDSLDLERVSVISGVPIKARMMQEEIFGPLLPVLRYSSLDDIVGLLSDLGAPLTTYLFTSSSRFVQDVQRRVKTGSICQNETLLHFAQPDLPFGGVGKSGSGRTHGHSGFRAFSNEVSVLEQRWGRGILPLMFPVVRPIQKKVRSWLLRILNW